MAAARARDRSQLEQLVREQAALRQLATLVAEGAPGETVFAVVAEQVATILRVPLVSIVRYEPDDTATECASYSGRGAIFRVGTRWSLAGTNVVAKVGASGRPARIDDYAGLEGIIAETVRRAGIRSTVGSPITVAGRLWGVMVVSSTEPDPLPPDTESRLADFTGLVATAIANGEAREQLQRLADEQAALRRVATLVAQGVPARALFAAVAREAGTLLGADFSGMLRFEPDATATTVAAWAASGEHPPLAERWGREDGDPTAMISETGGPARVDDWSAVPGALASYIRTTLAVTSSVGSPIVVGGRVWGGLAVHSKGPELMPPDTEARLQHFTELVATAVANTDAGAQVARLAQEQAALRRVATLVAHGAPAAAVFEAVAVEMAGLLDADAVTVGRYGPDGEVTVLAHSGPAALELEPLAVVRAPIVVDDRLWGVVMANWSGDEPLPPDAEQRMAQFAELLATAIANADSRDQLTASRARLVTEEDRARRRVVRDLHDGAQQRLVHAIVTLKLAQRAVRENDGELEALVGEALEHAERGNAELRELAHGILPSVLTRGGLRAGVDTVVSRLDLPVAVDLPGERFPAEIEASAYFVVAEAVTNVVKHARAERVAIRVAVGGETLRVEVRDDGIGGADPEGHGLVGMNDRVTALGGHLDIASPAGGGTVVAATLPLPAA